MSTEELKELREQIGHWLGNRYEGHYRGMLNYGEIVGRDANQILALLDKAGIGLVDWEAKEPPRAYTNGALDLFYTGQGALYNAGWRPVKRLTEPPLRREMPQEAR